MSYIAETRVGSLRLVDDRRRYRELVLMPCGDWEPLNDEQFHGRLSVNHARVCRAEPNCGYHETHDFAAALAEIGGFRVV